MNLIATRPFKHRGKALGVGDPFSAHPVIGEAYKRTGYAREQASGGLVSNDVPIPLAGEHVTEQIVPYAASDQTYETRVMVADVPVKRGRGRPRKIENA